MMAILAVAIQYNSLVMATLAAMPFFEPGGTRMRAKASAGGERVKNRRHDA